MPSRTALRQAISSQPPTRLPAPSYARCEPSTSTTATRSATGRKSVAFAVSFQSSERTLSDEDAAALREQIVTALAERFGAELRA